MAFWQSKKNDTNPGQSLGGPSIEDRDDGQNERAEGNGMAWVTLAGSTLVYFSSFGIINSFGFFQGFYQSDYLKEYPASEIAIIGTLQLGLLYLTSPIAGSLFDAYGAKYLYVVGGLGGVLSLVLLSITSPGHIWEQMLAQGVLFGLTVSCGVQPALAIVAQRWQRRRALAMGIVAAGSSAGGVCIPIMFSRLVPRIGFAWTTRAAALIILVCYLLASVTIKFTAGEKRKLKSIGDLLDYRGFRDPRYTCLAFGSFIVNLGLYAPYYYAEPFCALLDPHTKVVRYLLPLINASSFLGRIVGGYLADVVGRLNLLYPMTLLAGVLSFSMWLVADTVGVVIAFASLYGFCSGIFISVMPAATSQILPADKMGARLGALSSLTAISAFIGNPIAGTLIEANILEGYKPMIIYSATTLTAGGLLLFVGRLLHATDLRQKW